MSNIPRPHKTFNLDKTSKKKRNSKKNIFNFEFYAGRGFKWYHYFSTMNKYIDRSKLTEQKKNPIWVNSSSPTIGVETINGVVWFKNSQRLCGYG